MPIAQYPTNLEGIFGNTSVAAMDMANKQFQAAQLADLMNQQKAQQEYDFANQDQPLNLQQKQATIDQTQANTGYLKANTTGQNLKNQLNQATLESDIAATLSNNKTKMSADQLKQYADLGQQALNLADYLKSGGTIPLNADLPDEIKTLAAKGPDALRQWGQALADHSTSQLQAMQLEKQRGANSAEVARINQEGRIQAAALRASAGHRSADEALEKALTSGRWDQVATAYDYKAQQAQLQGDQDSATFYQQKAKEYADKFAASKVLPGQIDPIAAATGQGIKAKQASGTALPALRGTNKPTGPYKDDKGRIVIPD
ncbi:MAG TPA: hypothetical protein VFM18_21400 [Methanosarcina sp.]|nr:hypothetical protein [Methanosarcina sp.]